MADIIQIRRDTAANWTAANPILAQGEFGVETDTLKLKIGDGASPWTGLRYYHSGSPYDAGEGISINDFTINNTGIITVGTGSTNGTIKANGQDIAVKGLGSAAYVDTTTLPNKDLSNLSSTGKNIANWSSNITNYITEIPQDIKLTLSNGTLTLKAGSKVYVPNGSGTFDTVTTTADVSTTRTDSNKCMVWRYSNGSLGMFPLSLFYSGPTAPTQYQFMFWYDTTNNLCKHTANSGSTWTAGASFPICIVSTDGTKISAIDRIFNGFGYVGSTVFVLPGVKGLIPNGRNADGSLKNNTMTVQSVLTRTIPSNTGWHYLSINASGTSCDFRTNYFQEASDPSSAPQFSVFYNYVENLSYLQATVGVWTQQNNFVCPFRIEHGGSSPYKITSIQPANVFHAVDYNDYQNTVEQVEANTTNITSKQDKATALNYDNISNCITEIPQDIKLELSSGTLTLKAGSKLYKPNGLGVFDTMSITTDKTTSSSGAGDGQYLMLCQSDGAITTAYTNVSGSTQPESPTNGMVWYDTANNLVKRYWGGTWSSNYSLPIALVTITSGTFASINQVFNGFGYIGSTAFALPGVKGLIPNGRNTDGTLKTSLWTTSSVAMRTFTDTNNTDLTFDGTSFGQGTYHLGLDGFLYNSINALIVSTVIGTLNRTAGKITSLTSKTVFHAVDYNDTDFIAHQAMPSRKYIDLTLGATGASYTAPADGYFALSSTFNANGYLYMYRGSGGRYGTTLTYVATRWVDSFLPVTKGDVMLIQYNGTASVQSFKFIYANGAK